MPKAKTNYTAGSIGRTMIRTMIAMLPGTLAISGYNIADTFFVAKLGTAPLAAMGFTFPVIMLVNCIFHGLGVGVMATVAHAVGGARAAKAAKLVSAGMVLVALIALLLGVLGFFTMDATFRRFGAAGDVLELVEGYMSVWYLGCITAAMAMIGNNLLIAVGDSRLGGLVMCCGLGVNVLLDPLFIFGWGVFPAMGIRGAALATILAQAVGATVSAGALARRHHLWDLHAFHGRIVRPAWSRIIRFAVPATIGMILMPVGNSVITWITAKFGNSAVAGAAAAGRLEAVAFVLPMALGISLMPMIAQNYGAKFYSRIRRCHRLAMRFAFFFELAMALVFWSCAPYLVGFFTQDAEVAEIMTTYLRIVPWGFGLIEIHRYSGFFFTGCGRPRASAWLAALRIAGLLIPFSLLALWFHSLPGLFWARLGADVLAGATGWFLSRRLTRRLPADGVLERHGAKA